MAKQPSTSKLVDFVSLYREDNVRTTGCKKLPEMVASLKQFGFKANHPLVLSAKAADENGNVRYLVLCGNRRTEGLEFLADKEPENFKLALTASGGKVPAVIFSGLTPEEEILIRIDHGPQEDRVPLDEWSQFIAIKQLMRAYSGESQAKIAERLGILHVKGKTPGQPNRSFVQVRVDLARMPAFVQEEYRKLCVIGKDVTPVRWDDVKKLVAVFRAEYASYPEGDGPQFRTAWAKIMTPAPTNGDPEKKPKSLSPDSATGKAQLCSSRYIKRVLLAATNQGDTDLATIDATLASVEADSEILGQIRTYLGADEYANLVNRAREHQLAIEKTQAEVNAATATDVVPAS